MVSIVNRRNHIHKCCPTQQTKRHNLNSHAPIAQSRSRLPILTRQQSENQRTPIHQRLLTNLLPYPIHFTRLDILSNSWRASLQKTGVTCPLLIHVSLSPENNFANLDLGC
ncbi:unnamed protein product [Rhodiola kirilowii]